MVNRGGRGLPGRLGLWRIYRIDAYIRGGRYPDANWLADKLEMSRRTIERDLAHLRDLMSAPLEYDRTRGGYHYTAEFRMPPFRLSEGEILALFLSSRVLAKYRGSPYEKLIHDAFEKICAALPDMHSLDFGLVNETLSFYVGPPRGDEQQLLETHQLLLTAIRNHTSVDFDYYTASRNKHTTRRVDPYHMRNHDGVWYLIGYCRWREKILIFALDRMSDTRATEQHFEPNPDFSINEYLGDSMSLERSGQVETVRIRFDPAQARYIRERTWHASQKVTEHPDGALTLTLRVRGLGEIKRWVMGYGAHAEILAPAWLREEVARDVRKMGEKYFGQ